MRCAFFSDASRGNAEIQGGTWLGGGCDHLQDVIPPGKRHARQGVTLPRSTICGWLQEAEVALEPLYRHLKHCGLAENVVQTDDSPIPLQNF